MNNKVIIGIISVIAVAVGIFAGRSIAYSRAEEEKVYAVALKDLTIGFYQAPDILTKTSEFRFLNLKKDEKFLIVKEEYFKRANRGRVNITSSIQGTDLRKYALKDGDIFEIVGEYRSSGNNELINYVIKLGQYNGKDVTGIINSLSFRPLREGHQYFIKTVDGSTGWCRLPESKVKFLSDKKSKRMTFESISKGEYLGFCGKTPYDTKTEDGEDIRFIGDVSANKNTLNLVSKKDNKIILGLQNFNNEGGAEYSVQDIYTKQPNLHLWGVTAIAGTHGKNCGYWIVGKYKGKWVTFVSEKELNAAGYTSKEWHQLHSKIDNGHFIITSSCEYYPPGAQSGYQRTHIDQMRFEAYWDYETEVLKLRRIL